LASCGLFTAIPAAKWFSKKYSFKTQTVKKHFLVLLILLLSFACKDAPTGPAGTGVPVNLKNYLRPEGVMLQGFYWDVEPRGEWWNTLSTKVENWKNIGVDRIWLPPASKGMSGGYSMGYDPMDYFDFGNYNQMGTTETRFGSRVELESLISTAHKVGIQVIADIVLNHNSGGEIESNPYRNKNTYTLFRPKSGRFFRTAKDFHPNDIHSKDAEALFFEEQDICHEQSNVQKWFWKSDSSVAKYYKNTMKFDGWRFDYVKGFDPSVIKAWMSEVGGFGVLEAWDGNADYLKSWVDKTGSRAFDFAAFYNLEQALDGNNMTILKDRNSLLKLDPASAVTFVTNHDTEKDTNQGNRIGTAQNKLLAYAYIMTHPGYPCLFYLDYEAQLSKQKLEKLIVINRSLAAGTLNVLFADLEYYIAQRNGDGKVPGLVVAINNASASKTQQVATRWKNATLYDYSENTTKTITTDANGRATIQTPANNYTIWSLKKF
jgi:alpha-amylase